MQLSKFTYSPWYDALSSFHNARIAAIDFSLVHDDGQSNRDLDQADVILVGVSRSGKTPTSLYLAMQHGIKAANYPLIPDDFERGRLPSVLAPYKRKCFGLTIDPARLAQIRNERRPGSRRKDVPPDRFDPHPHRAQARRQTALPAGADAGAALRSARRWWAAPGWRRWR